MTKSHTEGSKEAELGGLNECCPEQNLKADHDETEHKALIYRITDSPPIYLTVLYAFQQALLSLSGSLVCSLLVADAVCASRDEEFKARLLSSTLFMNGITTFMMVTVGIRLPLFQGAASDYIVPLLAMASLSKGRCEAEVQHYALEQNITSNMSFPDSIQRQVILDNMRPLQGSLIVAGLLHALFGITGLVGILLRYIGPITVVPAILLICIYLARVVLKFMEVQWGIGLLTSAISLILSLFLSQRKTPIPMWTPSSGFHIIYYPLHQTFSILISILIGWLISGIMTAAGVFSEEKDSPDFYARTDSRLYVISSSNWFRVPYPGQYGPISFSGTAFVGFFIATLISILDSIGDYYACARICRVPPPPRHAMNRGIAIEGLCSLLSGAIGVGHATSTYGGNIGAVGITRVASRDVFLGVGIIYIVFGVVGKFSAVFISIPYPVLGGALFTMFGMLIGVVLSNLAVVSLTSSRNLAVIGTSLLVGIMVPYFVENSPKSIATGDARMDSILRMLLVNPLLAGGVLACLLDNTVPGSRDERGITAWQQQIADTPEAAKQTDIEYEEGYEVYEPLLPARFRAWRIMKYIPFLPDPPPNENINCTGDNEIKI